MIADSVPATERMIRAAASSPGMPSTAPPGTAMSSRGTKAPRRRPALWQRSRLTRKPARRPHHSANSHLAITAMVAAGQTETLAGQPTRRPRPAVRQWRPGRWLPPTAALRTRRRPRPPAAVVTSTRSTARETSGNQLRSISRGGNSKAVSIDRGSDEQGQDKARFDV